MKAIQFWPRLEEPKGITGHQGGQDVFRTLIVSTSLCDERWEDADVTDLGGKEEDSVK